MKVAQLKALLVECDPELDVVVSTDDMWSLDLTDVQTIDDSGVTVLCLVGK